MSKICKEIADFIKDRWNVQEEDLEAQPFVDYLDPAWLEEHRKERKKPFAKRIGDFFENLLDGGMFGGCK